MGQKFKPLRNKSVSDWLSCNVVKLTIRFLRISSFVRDFFSFACLRFSLFIVLFRSIVEKPIVFCCVFNGMFSLCICFLNLLPRLKNIDPVVVVSYLPVAGRSSVVVCCYTRFVRFFYSFVDCLGDCSPTSSFLSFGNTAAFHAVFLSVVLNRL